MKPSNVFTDIPAHLPEELVETLASGSGARIERIVSRAHASPPGFWYDQAETEWILLLSGSALLLFADESEPTLLRPGDWLTIPPHRQHRVESTDPNEDTIWLAVFWQDQETVSR